MPGRGFCELRSFLLTMLSDKFKAMKKRTFIFLSVMLIGCSSKDKYDVARYYDAPEQNKLLTSIVTFLFDAPPLTLMKDRFRPEHTNYYSFQNSKFSINKYFIAEDGTHYFYVIRPAPNPKAKPAA